MILAIDRKYDSIPEGDKKREIEVEHASVAIKKQIQAQVHFYLDLSKLGNKLEPTEKKLSHLQDPHSRFPFLLKSSETVSTIHELAILQINYNGQAWVYDFIDPKAGDLHRSNKVFMTIEIFGGKDGMLHEVASPSYRPDPGKKVMNLVRNIMEFAKLDHLLLDDGSTLLRCHEGCDEALTSLQMLETIKKGKSWYESQVGAVPSSSLASFTSLADAEVDQAYVKHVSTKRPDERFDSSIDYDHFRAQYLTIFENASASKEVYSAACAYLQSLTVAELSSEMQRLSADYPELSNTCKILEENRQNHMQEKKNLTLGDLLTFTVRDGLRQKGVNHANMHALRDALVANKDTVFFPYIVKTIAKHKSKLLAHCFAHIALDQFQVFMDKVNRKLLDPDNKLSVRQLLVLLFMQGSESVRQVVEAKILQMSENNAPDFAPFNVLQTLHVGMLKKIEDDESPSSVKIVENSTRINREKWIQYRHETGLSDPYLAVDQALQYFSRLPLDDFKRLHPALFKKWNVRFPQLDSALDAKRSFGEFLQEVHAQKPQEAKKMLGELMDNAKTHFSQACNEIFEEAKEHPGQYSSYILFMLAKYVVSSFCFFGVHR